MRWPIRLAVMTLVTIDLAAATSCRNVDAPQPVASKITMTGMPLDGVLVVSDTLKLFASTNDASGNVLLDAPVAWSSSNTAVATVSTHGVVSGVSAGSTTIRATSGAAFDTTALNIRVAVAPPPPAATAPAVQTVLNGRVTMSIPPGAVPAGVARLTVGPSSSAPASGELIAGTAFDFGPSGTQFAAPVTLTLQFDPATVPATARVGLAIYHIVAGDYAEVLGSVVDSTTNVVSAPIASFSSYAILRRATPASVVPSAGASQIAIASGPVPVRPSVRVLDARGRPVGLAPVSFAVTSGGGSLTGAAAVTDRDGLAILGSWTLGPTAGANTVTATVSGLSPVTFTATGVAGSAVRLIVSAEPVSSTAGATLATVVVTAQDVGNNTATSFNGPVSLRLGSSPAGATLGGSRTVNASAGVARFSTLTVNRPGTYTLIASSTGLTEATTSSFAIEVGAAAQLALRNGGGQSAEVNTPLPQLIIVQVADALGNEIASAGRSVSFAIVAGNGTVSPTSVLTTPAGQAATTWTLGSTAGTQSITVTSTGLNALTVTAIALLPLPPPSVRVTTTTTGIDLDDAFDIALFKCASAAGDCGGPLVSSGAVGANSSFTKDLAPGYYAYSIDGVAPNCTVQETFKRFTVTPGVTATIAFNVTCAPAGTVRVTAPSTGTDIADFYEFNIDGNYGGYFAAGDGRSFITTQGSHSIQLTSIPLNCTVNGPNPVTATVTRGATANVVFPVSCVPNPTLRVTVTTTGLHIPSAFTVGIDLDYYYYYYYYTIGAPPNGAASIRIRPGGHDVYLAVPANCTIGTALPVHVEMFLGATVDVAFNVVCR